MMRDLDLVIHGGTLVTACETLKADVGIRDGVIRVVCPPGELDAFGKARVDAEGLLVLPGAVDPHVHLAMPTDTTVSSDDWHSGTIAAACGGTTTVLDFVEPEPGESLLDAFDARRRLADAGAVVDYGLHMTLTAMDERVLIQIPEIVARGIRSFKTYTTYEGFRLDDVAFLHVMSAVGASGALVMVHCENDAIVKWCTKSRLDAGQIDPGAHPKGRPAIAEIAAISRVLALAETVAVPLYIVHVSTARGTALIKQARQVGQPVFGETCPQYLLLSASAYDQAGFEGAKFVCAPPLRDVPDQTALWEALKTGSLSTVGTDHCPFNFHGQKDRMGNGKDTPAFPDIPGGLPGIEARLALLYTFGVRQGRLGLNRWVDVCCAAPARVFGLYPQKGSLVPGADADIVLFDPERRIVLSHTMLHEHVDYTPYEGFVLQGYPVMTFARGQLVMKEGAFVGRDHHGRYIPRQMPC